PDLAERLALLSVREREVLEHILEGRQTRAIAEALCVSVKTVEFHRSRIREKLQVGSLAELFRLFMTNGEQGLRRDEFSPVVESREG
ncbi:MAG TPA: LuxR C-terminal-related transcriptional regulator, partial [Candidatus Accumulibacter phosphatis]|nr:LuxR C-terminal-related transcriptional regulator [Candidatus Accumulibacter phosphatis]